MKAARVKQELGVLKKYIDSIGKCDKRNCSTCTAQASAVEERLKRIIVSRPTDTEGK